MTAGIRAIDRRTAMHILHGPERYAGTAEGGVKALGGFEGLFRPRTGNHRVLFDGNPSTPCSRVCGGPISISVRAICR